MRNRSNSILSISDLYVVIQKSSVFLDPRLKVHSLSWLPNLIKVKNWNLKSGMILLNAQAAPGHFERKR